MTTLMNMVRIEKVIDIKVCYYIILWHISKGTRVWHLMESTATSNFIFFRTQVHKSYYIRCINETTPRVYMYKTIVQPILYNEARII